MCAKRNLFYPIYPETKIYPSEVICLTSTLSFTIKIVISILLSKVPMLMCYLTIVRSSFILRSHQKISTRTTFFCEHSSLPKELTVVYYLEYWKFVVYIDLQVHKWIISLKPIVLQRCSMMHSINKYSTKILREYENHVHTLPNCIN